MSGTKGTLTRAIAAAASLLAASGVVLAEDVKGKWYFGGNLGMLVTTDNVRSNAALIIAPLGPDGAPFTGDRGELVSCQVGRTDTFCDPRPDELLSRQTLLQQTFKLDGTIGYGLTSNLSIQLDSGYYKGNIENFDVYTIKDVPISRNPLDNCLLTGQKLPCLLTGVKTKDLSEPITAGAVTQVPIMLSGILRFRKDSNFNPYLGAGLGYRFNSLTVDEAVDDLNARLAGLHVIQVTDEFGPSYGRTLSRDPNTGFPTADTNGNIRFNHFATVTVDDGFQWQVVGGAEYFFNDRMSVLFDAKYVLAGQEISINMRGEDQIDLEAYTEDLYRADGSLRVFKNSAQAPPNPFDPNNVPFRYDCDTDGDGLMNDPPQDYNQDGRTDDACFRPDPNDPGIASDPSKANLRERIVVQGGNIRLSAFAFAFGVRFHF